MRVFMRAKIHGIKVTDKNLKYDGSQTLPKSLLEEVDIRPYEQIHVLNVSNGERWVTYAIEGKEGECILNGAAARLGEIGDELIILAYQYIDAPISGSPPLPLGYPLPKVVHYSKE